MQYADELFEQYDIFHSVLSKGKSSERPEDVSQTLLDSPKAGSPVKTLDVMVKWLRLRDQFLADTLVQLIVKMLYRLKRHQPSARIDGLNYVEEVATKTSVKTISLGNAEGDACTSIRDIHWQGGRAGSKETAV